MLHDGKEGLAFEKYPSVRELEEKHNVEIGSAYKTAPSASQFTHFIAQSQCNTFLTALRSKNKLYSFLMDGSTDAARVEQEFVIILYCLKGDFTEETKSMTRFFVISPVESADAKVHLKCVSQCLSTFGITELNEQDLLDNTEGPVFVDGVTDGASVNVGDINGLKGLIQQKILWSWCYAHRLELVCKNAFTSSLFKAIKEMLMRLFYLYEKSPKKIRELEELIKDLKVLFELPLGGNIPVQAHGSRWITHKRNALLRVLDRYGAYMAHITSLSQDNSLRAEDRAKLKGYLKKWMDYRVIYGCSLYAEILKPVSLLSLSLQGNDLDIVLGIKNILKAQLALKNTHRLPVHEWPTVKLFYFYNRTKVDERKRIILSGSAIELCY